MLQVFGRGEANLDVEIMWRSARSSSGMGHGKFIPRRRKRGRSILVATEGTSDARGSDVPSVATRIECRRFAPPWNEFSVTHPARRWAELPHSLDIEVSLASSEDLERSGERHLGYTRRRTHSDQSS